MWIGRSGETSTIFGLMTTRLPRTSGGRVDRQPAWMAVGEAFRAVVGAGDEGHLEERAGGGPLDRLLPTSSESGGGQGREGGRPEDADDLPAGHGSFGHRPSPRSSNEDRRIAQDEESQGRFEEVPPETRRRPPGGRPSGRRRRRLGGPGWVTFQGEQDPGQRGRADVAGQGRGSR